MNKEICDEVENMQGRSFVRYSNVTGNLVILYAHSLKCFAAGHDELNSVTVNRGPKRVVENK
jgi:hypothetical protein